MDRIEQVQTALASIAKNVGKPCTLKIVLCEDSVVYQLSTPAHPSPYAGKTGIRTAPALLVATNDPSRLITQFLAMRLEACTVPNLRTPSSSCRPVGTSQQDAPSQAGSEVHFT